VGLAYAETETTAYEHPEQLAEFYFSTQLNQWVFISPHLQWLKTTQAGEDEHFLAGLRINLSY
jgi:carbohydrate-selective porin OprB